MNNKKRRAVLLLTGGLSLAVLFVLILTVAVASAGPGPTSASYDLSWDVVGNGGTSMSSSSYIMDSTTGQAVTGEASSSSYSLRSGYWQNFFYNVLLPTIRRLSPVP